MTNNTNPEKSPLAVSTIDRDLAALQEFSAADRLEFVADMFEDWRWVGPKRNGGIVPQYPLFPPDERFGVRQELLERARNERDDGVAFSVLPDIPHPIDGGHGDEEIRGVGLLHPRYFESEAGVIFVPLEQGYMVEIPSDREQFCHLTMSTCSCIIGYGADRTVVAHVSLSIESEARAVLEYMKQNGINPDDTYVVASQTEGRTSTMGMPVVADPEDYYTSRGIPKENIIPFTNAFDDGSEDIAVVTVAPDAIRTALTKYDHKTRKLSGEVRETYITQIA